MEKIVKSRNNTMKSVVIMCIFYSLFLAALWSTAFRKTVTSQGVNFLIAYCVSFLLIFIGAFFINIIGNRNRDAEIRNVLKTPEGEVKQGLENVVVEFNLDLKDYTKANKMLLFKYPRFYVMWLFMINMELFLLLSLIFAKKTDFILVVLTCMIGAYILYPWIFVNIAALFAYKRQIKIFGRQKLQITSEGLMEENGSQKNQHKQIFDIQIDKEKMLLMTGLANFITIRKEYFASEIQYNKFLSDAYVLFKRWDK